MIDDYICRDKLYHNFKIRGENDKLLVDVCMRCGHSVRFVKNRQGQVDQVKYNDTHALDIMQPTHPEWEKYYGKYKGIKEVHTLQVKD